MISIEDFDRVDIRVGKIIGVEDFPKAKQPSYRLEIDFGPLGVKKSSAHITNYPKEKLLGKTVIAVVNFPPKQVADFVSEVLVLGAVEENGEVILLKPDKDAKLGSRIG